MLENVGDQPFFSDFKVANPQPKAGYRVALRGLEARENYCACPDYATNELGSCKHIEFVLARLGRKRRSGVSEDIARVLPHARGGVDDS